MRKLISALATGFPLFIAVMALGLSTPKPVRADGAMRASAGLFGTHLGYGRLFTNDILGDGEDRWRTGSYTLSDLRGPAGLSALPSTPGTLYELRFGVQVIAPDNLTTPAAEDRRYAGVISVGAHSYFAPGAVQYRLGFDLVATGPATGVGALQSWLHDRIGMGPPSAPVLNQQIGNRLHPTASFEMTRPLRFGHATLRPFLSAQAGVESFVRIGGDVVIGSAFQTSVLIRDVTTGQLYRGMGHRPATGWSFLLGADLAHMFDSALLPAGGGVTLATTRPRARAGVHWQGKRFGAYYGVTWLGREYEGQPEGQVVGSVGLRMAF